MCRATPHDSQERVRDAVDFVDLVGARIELRQPAAAVQGLCPFHEERTPSFGIDPVEKLYHCFGCGEGGDVFKFVMEIEGLDFGEALESLADRYSVGSSARRGSARAASAASATACSRCWSARPRYYVRVLWESRGGGGRARVPGSRGLEEGAARVPRGLLAVGLGPGRAASQRAGFTSDELLPQGWPSARATAGSWTASAGG